MRQVEVVAAVDAARRDDSDRRLVRLHVPDLNRRRVRPQHRAEIPGAGARHRRGEVERVLHIARGMLGRHVQRVEAVPLVFDLRTFDRREAHTREDLLHAVANERQRMAVTEGRFAAGQGDVDGVSRLRGCLARFKVGGPAFLELLLQGIGELAELALVRGRRRREAFHPLGEHAAFSSEVAVAHGLSVLTGRRCVQILVELGEHALDGVHVRQRHRSHDKPNRIRQHDGRATSTSLRHRARQSIASSVGGQSPRRVRRGRGPSKRPGLAARAWQTRRGWRSRAPTGSCDRA